MIKILRLTTGPQPAGTFGGGIIVAWCCT